MSLSRRDFVRTLGVGAAGAYAASLVSTRRQEAIAFAAQTGVSPSQVINLSNNENPMGPGQGVLDAIERALGPTGASAGRYPFALLTPLNELIAKKWNVKPENVLVGAGSTQILVNATHIYTSKEKARRRIASDLRGVLRLRVAHRKPHQGGSAHRRLPDGPRQDDVRAQGLGDALLLQPQ